MREFIVGLDLGQAADFTALAVVESLELGEDQRRFEIPHLERFPLGTGYPVVVDRVIRLLAEPVLRQASTTLVVDETGVGRPVVDLFADHPDLVAGLVPVTITGGFEPKRDPDGSWKVPKRDLVSAVQIGLQSRGLKVASSLPDAAVLTTELLNFQVKVTAAANDTYGAWREGTHDDLVLAVALPLWYAENGLARIRVW